LQQASARLSQGGDRGQGDGTLVDTSFSIEQDAQLAILTEKTMPRA